MNVKVGQIWQDCDKRMGTRMVRVTNVVGEYAYCEPVRPVPPHHAITWAGPIRLLLRRMKPTSTGWKLVRDATNQEDAT